MEFIDKISEVKNLWRFGILDISLPTLKGIGGKGHLRDCVAEKGTFLMLGVVGNVGSKVV